MSTERMSREALFEKVWATPMMRLAAEFGISDVALAKICSRLNIPRPGRGYWARLAAGERIKRPRLPKIQKGQEEFAYLRLVDVPVVRPRAPRPAHVDVDIATTLAGAHQIVVRLGKMLQHAQPDEAGRLMVSDRSSPALAVSVAVHRRALLIIDAICRSLGERGHDVKLVRPRSADGAAGKTSLLVVVADCELELTLAEVLDRRERARTRAEEEREEIHSALRGKPSALPRESFASGRLQISVRGLTAWRTSWSDAKTPIEQHLGAVIGAVEAEPVRRREEQERLERERLAREERQRLEAIRSERRRREEEAERKRAAEEEERRRYRAALEVDLETMASRWSKACEIRAFLDAVATAVPEAKRDWTFHAWHRWATGYAARLDPLEAPDVIAKPMAGGASDAERRPDGNQ